MNPPPDPAPAFPAIPVMPLQCPRENGDTYKRHADIEDKIARALRRPERDWPELAKPRGPGWMPNEVLVYLITFCASGERDDILGALIYELGLRVAQIAGRFVRTFDGDTAFEIREAVEKKVGELILSDPPCLQGEYLQVSFREKVEQLTLNAKAKRKNRPLPLRRAPVVDTNTGEEPEDPTHLIEDEGPSPEDLAGLLRNNARLPEWIAAAKAAAKDPRHVDAAILRCRDEWPIFDRDSDVPTLARRFDMTPRQIQNWINEGLRALRAAIGENK
jgi:ribosomal protein L39E